MPDSLNSEALSSLYRTTDMLRRRNNGLIEAHGLSMQQFNVLRILRNAGPEGLPTLDIGVQMIEKSPGVTRLLDKLESRGMVRRERQTLDRRQVLCFITQSGLDILKGLDGPIHQYSREEFACLSEAELGALLEVLARIKAHLGTLNK